MPAIDEPPPEPANGVARVLISTDVPARVHRLTTGPDGELLCETTPCAVTLPYGDHRVTFVGTKDRARFSTATVRVKAPTEIVNHTLGRGDTNPVGALLGGGAVVGGTLVLTFALALALHARKHHESAEPARNLAIGGLGSILGGAILMGAFPSTEQPGSTTQWQPERGRTIGGSVAIAF